MKRRILLLSVIVAAGMVPWLRGSRADDDEHGPLTRLPIQHSQDDGKSLWYQPIALKKGVVRFHETADTLSEFGKLIEYTLWSNDGDELKHLRLTLRPEPAKWRAAPPNSQANRLPASPYTVYEDLDGDSVFDTMVKVTPEPMSSYILFENQWIEVANSMAKWETRRTVRAVNGNREYFFAKGGWKR